MWSSTCSARPRGSLRARHLLGAALILALPNVVWTLLVGCKPQDPPIARTKKPEGAAPPPDAELGTTGAVAAREEALAGALLEIPAKPAQSPELEARGKALYSKHCAACHGASGHGDGPAAFLLFPKPRNFPSATFRLISTTNRQPTDADLYRTISRGMPGSAMPSWEHLPSADRWALVFVVRELTRKGYIANELSQVEDDEDLAEATKEAERFAAEFLTPGPLVTVPPAMEVTLERLASGRVLYIQNCAPCHDDDGRGRSQQEFKDNEGLPIFARDFTRGIFKGSADAEQIAFRILAGMPGSPMPGYQNIFEDSPEDLWSLIHHVRAFIPASAQARVSQRRRTIRVVRSSAPVTHDLSSASWNVAPATYLALMPLWWRNERVEGVSVRAVHDGERIALRLQWVDPTENRLALETTGFSDAAAIQLAATTDPPLFAMGDRGSPVAIWHWRAHWEFDLDGHKDVEDVYPFAAVDHYPSANPPHYGERVTVKDFPTDTVEPAFLTAFGVGNLAASPKRSTAVENLAAAGLGTLTSRALPLQQVAGESRWDRGMWELVISRPLAIGQTREGDDDVVIGSGGEFSVAFAVWDGGAGDRDGQKSVTIWHALEIED